MWFSVRGTCGVEIAVGGDVPLLPAVTVVVDAMAHPEK
jgi:uncharacterized protein YxjI